MSSKKDIMNGKQINSGSNDTLGREVLLALHGWMLDYAGDGHRQGYPFDPILCISIEELSKSMRPLNVYFQVRMYVKNYPK